MASPSAPENDLRRLTSIKKKFGLRHGSREATELTQKVQRVTREQRKKLKEKTRAIDKMRGAELENYLRMSDPDNEVVQALHTAN